MRVEKLSKKMNPSQGLHTGREPRVSGQMASSAKNGHIVQGTNVNGKPSKNSEPKSDALRLTLRKLLEGEFASFSISLHYFSWVCVCVHT